MANKRLQQQKQVVEINLKKREEEVAKREEKVQRREEAVVKREDEVNKKEKEVKKKEEENQKNTEKENDRDNAIKKLSRVRNWIIFKQFILVSLLSYIIYINIVLFKTYCKNIDHIEIVLNGASAIKVILLFMAVISVLSLLLYLTFLLVRKFQRNQNAIHRLELLKLRLELFTRQDLVELYRLDRELEMVYRIFEH